MLLIFANQREEPLGDRATVGRSADNTIRIDIEGTSRRHAQIAREGGEFWITDQGSTNGTTVNGQIVNRRKLQPGDVITFGGNDPSQTATATARIETPTAINDLDRTEGNQGTSLAELKGAIDALSERNEELHRITDERIDRLEQRTTAMENDHTAAVQAWTAESRALRAHDAEQIQQIKRLSTVFLGLICFSLATTCTVQVAQSLQRNTSISAAITEAVDPDSLGRLLGALISGTMAIALAQLTAKDQQDNGPARLSKSDVPAPEADRGH